MDGVSWLRSITVLLPTWAERSALTLTGAAALNSAAADASQTASGTPIWLDILIVLILLLVNGFFSGAEMAIVTLNDNFVRKQAEAGDKMYQRIAKLIDNPGTFLSTIQIGVTFAGFLSSAFAGEKFSTRIYAALDPNGSMPWLNGVTLIAVTLLISYLSLVIGELVPKQLAMNNPDKFSGFAVRPVSVFGRLMRPFTLFLNFSTNIVLRLLGIPETRESKSVTEEEIRMMVDVSTDSGNIEVIEKTMITNIFELNDKEVSEIMTHRMNVAALEVNTGFREALRTAMEEGYTRYPVYEEHIDNIIGILNVKDLMGYFLQEEQGEFNMRSLLREAYFTPETKHVDALFRDMQQDHASLAVVIDEYGGVSGIISMEDLVEEIVGNIQDEYDEEAADVLKNEDGSYTIDGLCELDKLSHYVPEFALPDDDEIDYDTVAGLVLHRLDRIPDADEHPTVRYQSYEFTVLEMDDRRIASVLLRVLSPEQEPEEGDSSGDNDNRSFFGRGERSSREEPDGTPSEIAEVREREVRDRLSLPYIQTPRTDDYPAGSHILKADLLDPNTGSHRRRGRGHSFINQ